MPIMMELMYRCVFPKLRDSTYSVLMMELHLQSYVTLNIPLHATSLWLKKTEV